MESITSYPSGLTEKKKKGLFKRCQEEQNANPLTSKQKGLQQIIHKNDIKNVPVNYNPTIAEILLFFLSKF